jgi:hypothetical protein
MGKCAKALAVVLMLASGFVTVSAVPAHADGDWVDNALCVNTGYGYYGGSVHVHIYDTAGTYHVKAFTQLSGWTWSGTGTYCRANSVGLGCATTSYVDEEFYKDGVFQTISTQFYGTTGNHSVSTGDISFGTSASNYQVIGYGYQAFDNSCSSEGDGAAEAETQN